MSGDRRMIPLGALMIISDTPARLSLDRASRYMPEQLVRRKALDRFGFEDDPTSRYVRR